MKEEDSLKAEALLGSLDKTLAELRAELGSMLEIDRRIDDIMRENSELQGQRDETLRRVQELSTQLGQLRRACCREEQTEAPKSIEEIVGVHSGGRGVPHGVLPNY